MKGEASLAEDAERLYREGRRAFLLGQTLDALACVEKALKHQPDNPGFLCFYGLCIARERGQIQKAITLCEDAVSKDSNNVENYIHLAKVYQGAGMNKKAIEVFRMGLKIQSDDQEIITELQNYGIRKPPVIPFLSRKNFLNKYLGLLLSRMGLR